MLGTHAIYYISCIYEETKQDPNSYNKRRFIKIFTLFDTSKIQNIPGKIDQENKYLNNLKKVPHFEITSIKIALNKK